MNETRLLAVDTLRCSEKSVPNVTTRSLCLLKAVSRVNVFSLEERRIQFPWVFVSFLPRCFWTIAALKCSFLKRLRHFPLICWFSWTQWKQKILLLLESCHFLSWFFMPFWMASKPESGFWKTYNQKSSESRMILQKLWGLQKLIHPMNSQSAYVQLRWNLSVLNPARNKVDMLILLSSVRRYLALSNFL